MAKFPKLGFIWIKAKMIKPGKKVIFSVISIIIILTIWKVSSIIIDAKVILPSPEAVIVSLYNLVTSKYFGKKVLITLMRGVTGFIISYLSGLIIGILAGIIPAFKAFIKPLLSVIKTTPVISIILLALIWFNTNNVPIFVAFLMAFPIVCTSIIEGITTVDKNLLEMAKTYKITLKKQIFHIYIPSIVPFILAGASMSLGIIWKVIIAAEVLSQPTWGIGTSLNEAKTYLMTEEVFAWTLIAILLSVASDTVFRLINRRFTKQ